MTRILLFMATNAAILLVITILFRVLGLDSMLYQNGVDLNHGIDTVEATGIEHRSRTGKPERSSFPLRNQMDVAVVTGLAVPQGDLRRIETDKWLIGLPAPSDDELRLASRGGKRLIGQNSPRRRPLHGLRLR